MRGAWTKDEDELLTSLMLSTPTPSWVELSQRLRQRTASGCRHRWCDVLKPRREAGSADARTTSKAKKVSRDTPGISKGAGRGEKTGALQSEASNHPPSTVRRTSSHYSTTVHCYPLVQHDIFYPSASGLAHLSSPADPPSSDTSSFTLSPPRPRLTVRHPPPRAILQPTTPRRASRTPSSNARLAPSSSPSSSDQELGAGKRMEMLQEMARLGESRKKGGVARLLLVHENEPENEVEVEVKRGLLFRSPKRRKR